MEKERSNLPIENSKKNELKPASLVRYENMSNELLELYKRKNADYGDSITNKICPTLASKETCLIHFDQPRFLGQSEVCCISSFPQDYNFGGQSPHYVCGMSVPPVMMAQVANQIWEQWLSKI